ncbi:MAG: cupin domain-containing protein [Acidimicrobiales bacterium]|nr:cupin domain-containing protein [Acidimicrobiales bacterium]
MGGLYELLLSGDETDGKTTVVQFTIPVGAAPPLHTHNCDETVYVIDGTLRYHIDGEIFEGGPGSIFHIPAGVEENFEPTSLLKIIGVYHGGSMDKFFAEAGELAKSRQVPPAPSSPPDLERVAEIGARHGLVLIPAA